MHFAMQIWPVTELAAYLDLESIQIARAGFLRTAQVDTLSWDLADIVLGLI